MSDNYYNGKNSILEVDFFYCSESLFSGNGNRLYYPGGHDETIAFGLNVYHKLYKKIEDMNAGPIDIRNMPFLCDVARLSAKRIEFLNQKSIPNGRNSCKSSYENAKNLTVYGYTWPAIPYYTYLRSPSRVNRG